MKSKASPYPRATVRKITKAHAQKIAGRTIDPAVFLTYQLFMEELILNAAIKSRAQGEKVPAAKDIRKVTMESLRRFKG